MNLRLFIAAAVGVAAFALPVTPAAAVNDHLRVTGDRLGGDPVVDDFAVEVRLPATRRVTRVWLELHDNEMPGPDPTVEVFGPRALFHADIVREAGGRRSIRFPLPLWEFGRNLLTVRATTAGPRGPRTLSVAHEAFTWSAPHGWGISGGGTRFAPPAIPPRATGCPFVFCKDADRDGLLDLWENVAANRLRPVLVLDESEDLLDHDDHYIRTFVRVTPVDDGRNVLFRVANAFSRDYGDPFFETWSHNGDVPTSQMLWRFVGDAIRLDFVRASRHTCLVCGTADWLRHGDGVRFDDLGRLKLWVEEDKHGLWWSNDACEDDGPYDCNGGPAMEPAVVNAGEPNDRFLDELDRIWWGSPFRSHIGSFPGEWVWSSRPDGEGFCGGLGTDDTCADHGIAHALKILRTEHPRHGDDDRTLITAGAPAGTGS